MRSKGGLAAPARSASEDDARNASGKSRLKTFGVMADIAATALPRGLDRDALPASPPRCAALLLQAHDPVLALHEHDAFDVNALTVVL